MWNIDTIKEINRPEPDLDTEKRTKLWHYLRAWKIFNTNKKEKQ